MNSNTKTILTLETVDLIMKNHFGPDTAVSRITEMTEGWFNAVYIVDFAAPISGGYNSVVLKTGVEDGKYVLSYEQDIMGAELKVYSLLENSMVPTPKILASDFSKSIINCGYFIMEKLEGDNWGHLESKISAANNEKLIGEIAGYTAAMHNIKGDYFGYIREDESFHFSTWREAFEAMVKLVISDGIKDKVDLPYDRILQAFDPLWPVLEEVKEPSLINFDMWKKNIMLIEREGEYVIDGIIDHERAFYGDPCAEFIAGNTICGRVESCKTYMDNYSRVSGKPFSYTKNHEIRLCMYNVYLCLLMGTEVYRYDEQDTQRMLTMCRTRIDKNLGELSAALNLSE